MTDYSDFFRLRTKALGDFNPNWLPQCDRSLLYAAKRATNGQRWLANYLKDIAPTLLAGLEAINPATEVEGYFTLLMQPRSHVTETMLELGSLAYSPLIKQAIDQKSVEHIQKTMGTTRYQFALDAPEIPLRHTPDAQMLKISESLMTDLICQGAAELTHLTSSIALQERVLLMLSPKLALLLQKKSPVIESEYLMQHIRTTAAQPGLAA